MKAASKALFSGGTALALVVLLMQSGACDDASSTAGSGAATNVGGANTSTSTTSTPASTTTSSTSATSTTSTTGSGMSCVPADCSDNVACTDDTCKADGTCLHVVNTSACAAGQFCDLTKGCTGAPICATVTDCKTAWMNDPCKTNLKCDAATSLCSFELLDKDDDGHPPIVCGGDDCDDANGAKHPGATEKCDGKDDDCDAVLDDGAVCSNPLLSCQNGGCLCAPANTCPDGCVDKQSDSQHCGDCDTKCDPGHQCVGGVCGGCFSGTSPCGASCFNLNADPQHCGNCTTVCPTPTTCSNGSCTACPAQTPDTCNGKCVNKLNDVQNCGTCGHACSGLQTCSSGFCQGGPSATTSAGPSGTTGAFMGFYVDWADCATANITVEVTTVGSSFSPSNIALTYGDVIRFTPNGNHSMTADDGSFDTPAGQVECLRFGLPATYPFHCSVDGPSMAGTITVN